MHFERSRCRTVDGAGQQRRDRVVTGAGHGAG
jgi:hypothetical protein